MHATLPRKGHTTNGDLPIPESRFPLPLPNGASGVPARHPPPSPNGANGEQNDAAPSPNGVPARHPPPSPNGEKRAARVADPFPLIGYSLRSRKRLP
jgi:hypothetical protein